MTPIPKKVEERLGESVKKFQAILASAKLRDVNESDTSIIITSMLDEIFGYDKFTEVASEHSIRGTSCDLAIKIEGKVQFLLEAKAIGMELKDNHVRQVVGYAVTDGIDWVVLTNGRNWRLYKVSYGKPIDQELVLEIDFLKLSLKSDDDLSSLYLISKEGWQKHVMVDFAAQKQALSRFFIAGIVLSEPVLDVIRRELKRACPEVKVKNEQIHDVLSREVLKGEVTEGDKADDARKKITRTSARLLRTRDGGEDGGTEVRQATTPIPTLSVPPLPCAQELQ